MDSARRITAESLSSLDAVDSDTNVAIHEVPVLAGMGFADIDVRYEVEVVAWLPGDARHGLASVAERNRVISAHFQA